MKLGVVVLNWNGKDVTPRCLDSISRSSCAPDQVVVVDNASTDGSADFVRSAFPHAAVIVNDSNLGFAEGNNVGIRYLLERAFDLILLLNNDTVLDAESLCELKRAARAQPAAAYGAAIYELSPPGRLWYGGGSISRLTLDATHATAPVDGRGTARPTDFITGCCLMFHADALRRIGLLDKDFFAYYEDVDWCLRARAAGSRLLVVPAAIVHHDVSHTFRRAGTPVESAATYAWAQSRPLVLYLAYRNRLLLARKHASGKLHFAVLATRRLARAALHAGMLMATRRGPQARAVVDGTRDGLRWPPQPARVERYFSKRPDPAERR
jgi:GT2 family glycosyltransferase